MAKVDLHVHSDNSDGSDSVKVLAENIIKNNIEIFALTDHDTVSGCEEIKKYLPEDIKFIPGIELTCLADDIRCHILGYNCDYKNKVLLDLIEKGKKLRRQKLETRIEFLKRVWNIDLTKEEKEWLYSRQSVVKTHIANILVNRGLSDDNVEAMEKFLKGCKTGQTRFFIEEAINAIISSGGIPVWAHPLGGEGEKHDTKEVFIPKLEKMLEFGIKGIECYYSRYNENETSFLKQCADKYGLLISGGSDYHGTNKVGISLAQLNTDNTLIDSNCLSILTAFI